MFKTLMKLTFKILLLTVLTLQTGCSSKHESELKIKGLVPDRETAVKIAEAIWLPIYGNKIYEQKPFEAQFSNGRWLILGTVSPEEHKGNFYILLDPKDCRVIMVGQDVAK